MSNFFPLDTAVCIYARVLFENGNFNGYCNECWRNGSEKQEEGDAGKKKEVCLDVGVLSGFHEDGWFDGNVIIFSLCFPLLHKGVVSYKKAGRSLDTHH